MAKRGRPPKKKTGQGQGRRALTRDQIVAALADATIKTDKVVCAEHGISRTTLTKYRNNLNTDLDLASAVDLKLKTQDMTWSGQLPKALHASIDFLLRATEYLDPGEPVHVRLVKDVLAQLAEVAMTRELLRERVAANNARALEDIPTLTKRPPIKSRPGAGAENNAMVTTTDDKGNAKK